MYGAGKSNSKILVYKNLFFSYSPSFKMKKQTLGYKFINILILWLQSYE